MDRSVRFSESVFFFFNDTATTEIYTLSLHDALPISVSGVIHTGVSVNLPMRRALQVPFSIAGRPARDRKSTRLNSSHSQISYAVFCLKKKRQSRSTSSLHSEPLIISTHSIASADTTL